MSELRQIPRWQIGEKARMKLKEYSWDEKCCLEDLNLKGIKISSKEKLPEGSIFDLNLDLKNDLVLDVQAQVRWNREIEGRFYYGLEFSRIKDVEKQEISQFLNENCADQIREHWWPKEGLG